MQEKPSILVLYYTQSGQLRQILDNVVQDIKQDANIDYVSIEPETPFPFPWKKASVFFDAMPETVQHLPVDMKPLPEEVMKKHYDLVIFGYQPWYLNPSLPISSFMQSPSAQVLNGKKVITVIGSRNMWLNGQEKMKEYLAAVNAELVGNIVLTDTYPNIISTLTVIRWAFAGKKEASGLLPAAGVQEQDIKNAQRYGVPILRHLKENKLQDLQQELLMLGAIHLKPGLVLLEKRGVKNFRFWSQFIREKGGPGDPNRLGRVMMFKNLLIVAIFILSPITSFSAFVKTQLQKRSLLKDVEYFKGLKYEKGRI